jgi:hypothetical protein
VSFCVRCLSWLSLLSVSHTHKRGRRQPINNSTQTHHTSQKTNPLKKPTTNLDSRSAIPTSRTTRESIDRSSKHQGAQKMIKDSQLNLSWPVIGAALKIGLQSTPTLNLADPSTYIFRVTNSLPSSSTTNPKAFSERYITVCPPNPS